MKETYQSEDCRGKKLHCLRQKRGQKGSEDEDEHEDEEEARSVEEAKAVEAEDGEVVAERPAGARSRCSKRHWHLGFGRKRR